MVPISLDKVTRSSSMHKSFAKMSGIARVPLNIVKKCCNDNRNVAKILMGKLMGSP